MNKLYIFKLFICITIVIGFVSHSKAQSDTTANTNKEKIGKITISGYIQAQYQKFDRVDSLGSVPKHYSKYYGGDFVNDVTSSRFAVRRGRLKITHTTDITRGVLSFDITEKGFSVKDVYLSVKDPYINLFELKAGIFNRPFGREVGYSSSLRESPERARLVQTIFPHERDLGVGFSFSLPQGSGFDFVELNTALVNGNSSALETDDYKDFIGNIKLKLPYKKERNFNAEIGFSYYNGSVKHIYEPVDTIATNTARKYYVYRFETVTDSFGTYKGFVRDMETTLACGTMGGKIKREYMGIDGMIDFKTPFGKLEIRGEYIWGTQPSYVNTNIFDKETVIYNDVSTFSPSGPTTGVSWAVHKIPQPFRPVSVGLTEKPHNTMIRQFNGGYLYFVQTIFDSKHQVVFKYDWYDPNTEIEGNELNTDYIFDVTDSIPNTFISPADVKYATLGFGWIWTIQPNVKLTVYYEHVKNEITEIDKYEGDINSGWHPRPGMKKDINDDVFTIRLQYMF